MENMKKNTAFLVELEEYVQSCKIIMDANIWMDDAIERFEDHLIPLLFKHNATLVMPVCIYDEVKRKLASGDPEASRRADHGLRVMGRFQDAGFLRWYGDSDDEFGDAVIDSFIRKKRTQSRLMLISNDYNLAKSIRDINNLAYGYGFPVVVKALAEDGTFMEVEDIKRSRRHAAFLPESKAAFAPAFAKVDRITTLPDAPCVVASLPGEGDEVQINGKTVRLEAAIGEGGEGTVYRCSMPGTVVKIYHRDQITVRRAEKLRRMTAKRLDVEGIAWPLCLAENQQGQFVGYIMREVKGKSLDNAVFNVAALKAKHPDWTRRNTVAIAVDLLDKIRILHRNNILIGDIKADNILLCDDGKVWLTDCDSFQLEGFPCPVATPAFTPPELQDKDCRTLLRTPQNEYFSVAILLFMLVALPGKSPYAHAGGGSPADNIRKMEFPYPLKEKSSGNQPGGTWRYMWSHLPYHVKEAFYKTFRAGEEYAAEGKRLDVEYWYRSMYRYLHHDLDRMMETDVMSESLFPTRFKKHKDLVYGKCAECGREEAADLLRRQGGYCMDCLEKNNLVQCPECGAYTVGPKMRDGLCMDCYRKKHEAKCTACGKTVLDTQLHEGLCKACLDKPHHTIKCSACPRSFEFTNRDYFYFREQGWEDPKLCPECRKLKKQAFLAYQEHRKHAGAGRAGGDGATSGQRQAPKIGLLDTALHSVRSKLRRI